MTILAPERLTVTPDSGGSWVDGVYQPSWGIPFVVVGSVQPVIGDTVEMLPEAARTTAELVVYADFRQPQIKTTDIADGKAADVVVYRDRSFRAVSVANWTAHTAGIPHRVYGLVPIGADEVT